MWSCFLSLAEIPKFVKAQFIFGYKEPHPLPPVPHWLQFVWTDSCVESRTNSFYLCPRVFLIKLSRIFPLDESTAYKVRLQTIQWAVKILLPQAMLPELASTSRHWKYLLSHSLLPCAVFLKWCFLKTKIESGIVGVLSLGCAFMWLCKRDR